MTGEESFAFSNRQTVQQDCPVGLPKDNPRLFMSILFPSRMRVLQSMIRQGKSQKVFAGNADTERLGKEIIVGFIAGSGRRGSSFVSQARPETGIL